MHPRGAAAGACGPRGVAGAAVGLAGIAALAGSVGFVRATAAGHLYREDDVPPAPVALVLGAKVYPDGTPSAFLAARLDLAKRLFEAGKVRVILVSGDNMAPEYNEPDAMRDYLIEAGVPAEQGGRRLCRLRHLRLLRPGAADLQRAELIMVTQSYHLPRAVATCRALGVETRRGG